MSNKTTAKLTRPQRETLRQTAWKDGISASDSYQPIQKLLALGLITREERRLSHPRFRITDAGRAVLQEQPHA